MKGIAVDDIVEGRRTPTAEPSYGQIRAVGHAFSSAAGTAVHDGATVGSFVFGIGVAIGTFLGGAAEECA